VAERSKKPLKNHPVEFNEQVNIRKLEEILKTPETVPVGYDVLKEKVSLILIQPYSFPQRSLKYELPNGKTIKENEIFNEQRCKVINKKWDGGNYNLWTNGNSQHGQDRIVRDFFNGAKYGRYIEVGSYDGETFSNTWILDWCLKWEGLLIDPSTKNLDISGNFRPNAVHYHTAIHKEDKEECIFFENSDTALAGLEDTVKTTGVGKKFMVRCLKLQHLIDQQG